MHSVAPYLFQLLDEEKRPIDLWRFHGKNTLRSVLIDYYSNELNQYNQFESNRIFRVANLFESDPNTLSGVYQTGEFGYSSSLYDTKKKKITHQKATSEADMMPFQFMFAMPKSDLPGNRVKGLLLLARHKTYGIRILTIPHLKLHIESRFPGITFEVKRLLPAALARAMLQRGKLQKIRLIKYKMPKTLEGLLDEFDQEVVQEVEIVIKAKRNSSFNSSDRFLGLLEGKGEFRGLYSVGDLSCDNIKLDIELGKRRRTINIGKKLVTSDIDITEELTISTTGYPTNSSWFKHVDELASELLVEVGVSIEIETSTKVMPVEGRA